MTGHEANAHESRLKVTAGPVHHSDTHQEVPVNGETIRIENDHAIVSLCVRIKGYTGMMMSYFRRTQAHLALNPQDIPKTRPPPAHTSSTLYIPRTCTPYVSQSSSKSA